MTGSTIPMDAQLSSHPVHRATALLHQALHAPPPASPDPAELWDEAMFRTGPEPIEIARGPVSVTTLDDSLVTLLGFAPFQYVPLDCQPPVTESTDVSAADTAQVDDGEDMLDHAVQAQLQGLVQAFHRRQRQASLLVACSIAAAVILTLGGLILLFGTIGSGRADQKASRHGETSVARTASHAALAAPTLSPIRVKSTISDGSNAKIITAQTDRPLALGPLLPFGVARYVLLRGLPEKATLSAGRRTATGTWMVKGEDIAELTLTFEGDASGDYPTEIYLLDSGQGPQARRRMILRVNSSPKVYSAGFSLGWPTALSEMPQASEPADVKVEAAPAPLPTSAQHERAKHLLAEGDIVTARRILIDLAEHGQADAAYKLGLTYDDEVLARAGLGDIEGDMDTAQGWYARAAEAGHTGAAQRLEVMTRRRAGV